MVLPRVRVVAGEEPQIRHAPGPQSGLQGRGAAPVGLPVADAGQHGERRQGVPRGGQAAHEEQAGAPQLRGEVGGGDAPVARANPQNTALLRRKRGEEKEHRGGQEWQTVEVRGQISMQDKQTNVIRKMRRGKNVKKNKGKCSTE